MLHRQVYYAFRMKHMGSSAETMLSSIEQKEYELSNQNAWAYMILNKFLNFSKLLYCTIGNVTFKPSSGCCKVRNNKYNTYVWHSIGSSCHYFNNAFLPTQISNSSLSGITKSYIVKLWQNLKGPSCIPSATLTTSCFVVQHYLQHPETGSSLLSETATPCLYSIR